MLAPGSRASSGTSGRPGNSKAAASGGGASPYEQPDGVSPAGNGTSGAVCGYVNQSDVNAVLPGAPPGTETALATGTTSYCAFGSDSLGSLTVKVKNVGVASDAAAAVRQQWAEMSAGSGQTTQTFTAAGGFAFEVGSTTNPPNGAPLYALNAQGSRGGWYVEIQYYAHRPASTGAMHHLLDSVLSRVPG